MGPAPSSVSSPDHFFTHPCCKDTPDETDEVTAARILAHACDQLGRERPAVLHR
jgi:hypothetical protein